MAGDSETNIDATVGAALQRLRRGACWSIERLALTANISVSALRDVEAGRRRLHAAEMMVVGAALKASPHDFYPDRSAPSRSALDDR